MNKTSDLHDELNIMASNFKRPDFVSHLPPLDIPQVNQEIFKITLFRLDNYDR